MDSLPIRRLPSIASLIEILGYLDYFDQSFLLMCRLSTRAHNFAVSHFDSIAVVSEKKRLCNFSLEKTIPLPPPKVDSPLFKSRVVDLMWHTF